MFGILKVAASLAQVTDAAVNVVTQPLTEGLDLTAEALRELLPESKDTL